DKHDPFADLAVSSGALLWAQTDVRLSGAAWSGLAASDCDPACDQFLPLLDASAATRDSVVMEISRVSSPHDGCSSFECSSFSSDRFCSPAQLDISCVERCRLQPVRVRCCDTSSAYDRDFLSLQRRREGRSVELPVCDP